MSDAFSMLFIVSSFLQTLQSHVIRKSVTLTPNHTTIDGAQVQSHLHEVTTVNNTWIAQDISQKSWHFVLILDDSWGFASNLYSSIQITLHSPSVTTETHTFDSLVFGFTTNNHEYISTLITMNQTVPNQIYPNCNPTSPHPPATGAIASLPSLHRKCDIAGGLCTNWKDMRPVNRPNIVTPIPFTFQLENDPTLNTFNLSYRQNVTVQQCAFTSLQTNNGLNVYIGVNGASSSLQIQSFEIDAISNPPLHLTSSPNDTVTKYQNDTTFMSTDAEITMEDTGDAVPSNIMIVRQSNEFRYIIFPISVAAACLILLVIIRIGFKHKRQETMRFDRSAVAFEHVESFSVIYAYFIRVHCRETQFLYDMMDETEAQAARPTGCAHWKESKYDRFIEVVTNEFKLHGCSFRLYEIVNGQEEDIKSIDDVIVAFDCVMKDTDTLASIDVYVQILENTVSTEIKHSEQSVIRPNEWCNRIVPLFRHKGCKKNSIEIEKKRRRQKAMEHYLERKVLELMEVTTHDGMRNCESVDDTLNYYD